MSQAQEPIRTANKKNARARSSADQADTAHPKAASPKAGGSPGAVPADTPYPEGKTDILTELWLRFGRFGWDIAGIALIAFALITLIGLISRGSNQDWAKGLLISLWVNVVAVGFGWGWPFVVISICVLGILCLRQRVAPLQKINLPRVLALEGFAFGVLAVLAILDGWSLNNAADGLDGGVIGWGLATLLDRVLPVPWGIIFLVGLMILLGAYGSGLTSWLFRGLVKWLDAVNPPGSATVRGIGADAPQANEAIDTQEGDDSAQPAAVLQQVSGRSPDLPPLDLLLAEQGMRPEESYIQETARKIEQSLGEFGVPATVKGYRVGPTITQYAVEPGYIEKTGPDGEPVQQKVRVSQISALRHDLALALSAERLRIEAPVPGRSYVGIEVPNQLNAVVRLRSLLESEAFNELASPLAVALGKDVSGQPLVADLARMPHLLIAGTTGSGKSVCIAAIATCLTINNQPADLRIVMMDPKMVELVRFNGLPHLFGKVETEIERMLGVLRWALMEMDHRYKLLEDAHSRDILSYNRKMEKRGQPKLPRIVIIIDELADLMMTVPDQTEHSLIRLAQMARATGIHLVVATQRPSTDVVTGLIKANFPARLAFSVASSIDSRVILDTGGAENLLGKGDMLFLNPEAGTPLRAQGVMVSDGEIEAVSTFWKQKMAGTGALAANEPAPWEELIESAEDENGDALVEQAVKIVRATQRASTSLLQRRLRIGYPRAARLMDQLEDLGVVGPSQGGGKERDVLQPPEDGETGNGSEDESF